MVVSWIVFACIFVGALLGMFVRAALPEGYLRSDTKDVVGRAIGLIMTIAAVVLGLLVASAKSSYDMKSGQIKQMTANIILLDRILEEYGPETDTARDLMRRSIAPLVDRIWRESVPSSAKVTPLDVNPAAETVYYKIQELAPRNDVQRSLQARAIQISTDLAQTRFLLFEETGNSIPIPFLSVLVFWLTIIFASFGLFARPNAIVIATLFVCALSASSAIFLILDLDRPFIGVMSISSAPMRNALAPLGP